jgi:membrane protease YdiL (CAAX protease family)
VLRPLSLAASFAIFLYLGWMLLAVWFQPREQWFGVRARAMLLLYYACLDGFALALSAGFLCGLEGLNFGLLGLAFDRRWLRHIGAGLGWGAGVISAAVFLLFITGAAHIAVFAARSPSYILFLAFFLALSSTFEELAFRGYALVRAADSVGPVIACLASSALFGLAHYGNPQATLLSSLNTALAGVLLSIARFRSRALWMPIALHFAWNFSLGPLFSFPVSGYTFGAEHLSASAAGPQWFSGGAYGPEASLALTLALAVAIPLLLRFPREFQPLPSAPKQS